MKVAIIGSRTKKIDSLEKYLPKNCCEIVSGGANGIDKCAAEMANSKGLKLTEFLPEYNRYGRGAPLVRNKKIVEYSDIVLAFWDGSSKGTLFVIEYCKRIGKECKVILI